MLTQGRTNQHQRVRCAHSGPTMHKYSQQQRNPTTTTSSKLTRESVVHLIHNPSLQCRGGADTGHQVQIEAGGLGDGSGKHGDVGLGRKPAHSHRQGPRGRGGGPGAYTGDVELSVEGLGLDRQAPQLHPLLVGQSAVQVLPIPTTPKRTMECEGRCARGEGGYWVLGNVTSASPSQGLANLCGRTAGLNPMGHAPPHELPREVCGRRTEDPPMGSLCKGAATTHTRDHHKRASNHGSRQHRCHGASS